MLFAENFFYDFAAETKQQADLFFPDTWQPEDSTENEMINGDNVIFDEERDNKLVGETF